MFRIVFLCVILFTEFAGYRCDDKKRLAGYTYNERAKAWLRLHVIPATWSDARMRCHLEGGVLVSPTTHVLKKAVIAMMKEELNAKDVVFTGLYEAISKGDFVSIEGVPLSQSVLEWAEGEPSNSNDGEDCLTMNQEGKVADVNCSTVLPYFCRKEAHRLHDKCQTTDHEYRFEPRTQSCYRFHRFARTWHNAAKACSATQGHLLIINSAQEAKIVREMFKANTPDKMVGAVNPNYALIGFWTWEKQDYEWLTIHGETLAEAGYDKWKSGEPNNYLNLGEWCGAVWRRGGLADVTCDQLRYPFICETYPRTDNDGDDGAKKKKDKKDRQERYNNDQRDNYYHPDDNKNPYNKEYIKIPDKKKGNNEADKKKYNKDPRYNDHSGNSDADKQKYNKDPRYNDHSGNNDADKQKYNKDPPYNDHSGNKDADKQKYNKDPPYNDHSGNKDADKQKYNKDPPYNDHSGNSDADKQKYNKDPRYSDHSGDSDAGKHKYNNDPSYNDHSGDKNHYNDEYIKIHHDHKGHNDADEQKYNNDPRYDSNSDDNDDPTKDAQIKIPGDQMGVKDHWMPLPLLYRDGLVQGMPPAIL